MGNHAGCVESNFNTWKITGTMLFCTILVGKPTINQFLRSIFDFSWNITRTLTYWEGKKSTRYFAPIRLSNFKSWGNITGRVLLIKHLLLQLPCAKRNCCGAVCARSLIHHLWVDNFTQLIIGNCSVNIATGNSPAVVCFLGTWNDTASDLL